jgi:predicted RNA-binding protein associated with RNAse of E/G family
MKRKYADRRGWRRIVASRVCEKSFLWPDFRGEAVLIRFDEIKAPMSVAYGGIRVKTVDRSYSWLQLFPQSSDGFVLTSMFDDRKYLVQCYFDIVERIGRDSRGTLWFDDLYLDLILFPDHHLFLVDQNELDEALEANIITASMHRKAWRSARRLKRFIDDYPDFYPNLVRRIRSTFPD